MHWKLRLALLWKFVKLIPEARTLELEIQKIKQKYSDLSFADDLSHGRYENERKEAEAYCKGIEWCLKRFS
jgi:hypothetical protein